MQLADGSRVGCTLSLIAFISFSSQIFIIYPSHGRKVSPELLQLLGPFNVLVFFVFLNYALVLYTDPGRVPREWVRSPYSYQEELTESGT